MMDGAGGWGVVVRRVWDFRTWRDSRRGVLGHGGMEGVGSRGMVGPRGFLSWLVFSVPPAAMTTRSPRR